MKINLGHNPHAHCEGITTIQDDKSEIVPEAGSGAQAAFRDHENGAAAVDPLLDLEALQSKTHNTIVIAGNPDVTTTGARNGNKREANFPWATDEPVVSGAFSHCEAVIQGMDARKNKGYAEMQDGRQFVEIISGHCGKIMRAGFNHLACLADQCFC